MGFCDWDIPYDSKAHWCDDYHIGFSVSYYAIIHADKLENEQKSQAGPANQDCDENCPKSNQICESGYLCFCHDNSLRGQHGHVHGSVNVFSLGGKDLLLLRQSKQLRLAFTNTSTDML